jgi:hypothetical protein
MKFSKILSAVLVAVVMTGSLAMAVSAEELGSVTEMDIEDIQSLVVWDSNDYILKLYGNFTKEELINLAISNENEGF